MSLNNLSYKLSQVFPKSLKRIFNNIGLNGSMFRDGRRDLSGLNIIGLNDIFLCSYPKSGNTWLRLVIAYLMDGDTSYDYTLKNIEEKIPEVGNPLLKPPSQYTIKKSHYPYFDLYPKIIYVYRDPRDVAISFYHYRKKFYNAEVDFVDSVINDNSIYGTWKSHIDSALNYNSENSDKCLMLKYEDMLLDPNAAVKDIALFLDISVGDDLINAIISKTSFEKLRKNEKNNGSILKMKSGFFRNGTKEQWRNDLKPEQLKYLNDKYSEYLKKLRYPLI